jgi:hypothetical protein
MNSSQCVRKSGEPVSNVAGRNHPDNPNDLMDSLIRLCEIGIIAQIRSPAIKIEEDDQVFE